ncbi:hypothetical protein ACNHUS_15325 [Actinomycetes bacterium M1A6_2h]
MRRFGTDERSPQDEPDAPRLGERFRGSARDFFEHIVSWADGSRIRSAVIGAITMGVIVLWALLVMLAFGREGMPFISAEPVSVSASAVVAPMGAGMPAAGCCTV